MNETRSGNILTSYLLRKEHAARVLGNDAGITLLQVDERLEDEPLRQPRGDAGGQLVEKSSGPLSLGTSLTT